jgi:hypothetical protein
MKNMIINSKLLFKWKVSITLGLLFFIVTPIIISALIKPTTDLLLSSKSLNSDYKFDISISKINIKDNSATITITPRLEGNYGEPTKNGSLTFKDVELLVDSYQGSGKFSAQVGQVIGRQEFKVLLKGNSWRYPFDNYLAGIGLLDSKFENQPLSLKEVKEYLPGFRANSNTIPNYRVDLYPKNSSKDEQIISDLNKGIAQIEWRVMRLPGDIYAAILLAILMLISAGASLSVTRAVWSGKRPPSINALAWLAAFLFAMFQIRASLPGTPPSGTLFDLVIFYPILIVLLAEMAAVVYLWIKRDDWDLKNVPKV